MPAAGHLTAKRAKSGAWDRTHVSVVTRVGLIVGVAIVCVIVAVLTSAYRADEVAAAVRNAIARGAIGFDAVKHLVLCRIERRPPRLDMTVYPYLPQAHVAMTSAKTYLGLLTGAAS